VSRYIHVFEEAGAISSNPENPSKPERGPEPGLQSISNIDRGEPRKCPQCGQTHYGSSQLGIFCTECEYDKITSGELDLPKNPQYSQTRETW
jgi:hypothetical protein